MLLRPLAYGSICQDNFWGERSDFMKGLLYEKRGGRGGEEKKWCLMRFFHRVGQIGQLFA